jgi:hypothetical protein
VTFWVKKIYGLRSSEVSCFHHSGLHWFSFYSHRLLDTVNWIRLSSLWKNVCMSLVDRFHLCPHLTVYIIALHMRSQWDITLCLIIRFTVNAYCWNRYSALLCCWLSGLIVELNAFLVWNAVYKEAAGKFNKPQRAPLGMLCITVWSKPFLVLCIRTSRTGVPVLHVG